MCGSGGSWKWRRAPAVCGAAGPVSDAVAPAAAAAGLPVAQLVIWRRRGALSFVEQSVQKQPTLPLAYIRPFVQVQMHNFTRGEERGEGVLVQPDLSLKPASARLTSAATQLDIWSCSNTQPTPTLSYLY